MTSAVLLDSSTIGEEIRDLLRDHGFATHEENSEILTIAISYLARQAAEVGLVAQAENASIEMMTDIDPDTSYLPSDLLPAFHDKLVQAFYQLAEDTKPAFDYVSRSGEEVTVKSIGETIIITTEP